MTHRFAENAGAGRNLRDINVAAPMLIADDPPRTPEAIARRRELKVAGRDELGRLLPGSVLERAGRPEGHGVTSLARLHPQTAMAVLREIVDDPKAPPAARATAAQALLDRGWGKAPIQIDLNARANFCDFLRDFGIRARARQEAKQTITYVATSAALDDQGRNAVEDADADID